MEPGVLLSRPRLAKCSHLQLACSSLAAWDPECLLNPASTFTNMWFGANYSTQLNLIVLMCKMNIVPASYKERAQKSA